jgi:hypothetical protein
MPPYRSPKREVARTTDLGGGQWLCCGGKGPHYDGAYGNCIATSQTLPTLR